MFIFEADFVVVFLIAVAVVYIVILVVNAVVMN